jgi:uncharacterized protein YuzE
MKLKVEVTQDPTTGEMQTLYMRVKPGRVARTVTVGSPDDPEMLADVDEQGQLLGVEVLSMQHLRRFCEAVADGLPS